MNLKFKISKEDFDQLEETIKGFYEEKDGEYQLKVDGIQTESKPDESLKEELQKLKDKHEEFLNETKTAKQEKQRLERELEEMKNKKAHDSGDFESLLKSSETKRQELETKYNELQQKIAEEKLDHEASKIANKIGNTPENSELLTYFVKQRLKYTDEGLKVTDEKGNATISTVDELEKEFTESNRYAALVKGSQASGGGATGSGSGGVKTWNDYSERELTEIANNNPAKFDEILKTKQK